MSTTAPFDAYAETYDSALDQALSVSGEDKEYFARGRIAWLTRRLNELKARPRSVLDFGCGTGTAIPYFLELLAAERVIGVDVSTRSLEVATAKYGSDRVLFRQCAEYQPEGNVDLAFCNGVFHHIPPGERAAAVQYVYDSLRSGGLFAYWENNPWNPATRYVMSRCPFDEDAVTLSPPESHRLLRSGGFQILRTDFLFIFPRALRWFRVVEPWMVRLPLGTQYLIVARRP